MADDSGFAIRCPSCQKWSYWEKHPRDYALRSRSEFCEIMAAFQAAPRDYQNPKLLRCKQIPWECPAPFEAFVCDNEDLALELVPIADAWSVKRDFRLFRYDAKGRWDRYYGILFNGQPVRRDRDIRLERLLDPDLLSRALLGMATEAGAPITVFSAQVHDQSEGSRVYWVPIESYSHDEFVVPPRFNSFCHVCRECMTEHIIGEFWQLPEHRGFRPPNDVTWRTSPEFLDYRAENCPCYRSDLRIIRSLEEAWLRGDRLERGLEQQCWAGLIELGFPLVVHDHLVGILMSGQFFIEGTDLLTVDEMVELHPPLKACVDKLGAFREVLTGERAPERDEEWVARFRITRKELEHRTDLLQKNVARISRTASAHYRSIRIRSEAVFRQELIGRIENDREEIARFREPLCHILRRMREFWAFDAAYLLECLPQGQEVAISALGAAWVDGARLFGRPGRPILSLAPIQRQEHPQPWLYDVEDLDALDKERPWVQLFLKVLERAKQDPVLRMPKTMKSCFNVAVPFADRWYIFVFPGRDLEEVCRIPQYDRGKPSELCQEAVLTTCTVIVYDLGAQWFHTSREEAWRDFSLLASHRIGNQLDAVGGSLFLLTEFLREDPPVYSQWEERLAVMQDCIRSAKLMLAEHTELAGDVKPSLEAVDLVTLIRRAAAGLLPTDATLDVQTAPDTRSIVADPNLMEQVFRELIVNAVRAGGPSVRIRAATSTTPASCPLPSALTVRRHCRILFSNNGPAIPPEQRERIFEPFVTFTRGGSGLGLATVQRIIAAHKGTISLLPEGPGATFEIRLPMIGVAP